MHANLANLSGVQISFSAKFEHNTNLVLCLICPSNFGTLPNLSAQFWHLAQFLCLQIWHFAKFEPWSNLTLCKIWRLYKFGTLPKLCAQFWHLAKFLRTNLAPCLICVRKFGSDQFDSLQNLNTVQIWQSA